MQNRSQEGLSRPRDDEILDRMETLGVESFVTNLAVGDDCGNTYPFMNQMDPLKPGCWLEVCRVHPWDGSPDVAGVGVRRMFNLFITVSLTITNARNIHTPDMSRHGLSYRARDDPIRLDPSQYAQRVFHEADLARQQHSTGSFLSASFVFCIAMLLASLLSEVDNNSNA
jgi:hypothetical protein